MNKELKDLVGKLSVEELFELKEEVEKRCLGTLKVGSVVHVVNVSSWEGWSGRLVEVKGVKAYIELDHKQKGKVVYPTALVNVRQGSYPQKK